MAEEPRAAWVIGKVIDVKFPDGSTAIIQLIVIDCPGCGHGTIQLSGHHIRQVYDLLGRTIAACPDKVGEPADVQFLTDIDRAAKAGDN